MDMVLAQSELSELPRFSATLLHGYANPLKRLGTSESVNLHKCLILLDSCRIHATRCQIERIVLRSLPIFKPQDGRALSFAGKFTEEAMNEDRLNMDIRKYLKVVGVTSQREIELAVRAALAKGTLVETSVLKPTMILCIPEIGLNHVIDGEIALV